MADTDIATKLAELRKAFPEEVVGKLPRGNVQLDYVGHAAVTDRLLTVDPEWTWEPLAMTEDGLPAYDKAGGLWIKLTVCGITRLGYGDGADPKVRIGDALRNAAMRFGVALDLWSKDELESTLDNPQAKNVKPTATKPAVASDVPTKRQVEQLKELMTKADVTDAEKADFFQGAIGKDRPQTKADMDKSIAFAETLIADMEDAARELGSRG